MSTESSSEHCETVPAGWMLCLSAVGGVPVSHSHSLTESQTQSVNLVTASSAAVTSQAAGTLVNSLNGTCSRSLTTVRVPDCTESAEPRVPMEPNKTKNEAVNQIRSGQPGADQTKSVQTEHRPSQTKPISNQISVDHWFAKSALPSSEQAQLRPQSIRHRLETA